MPRLAASADGLVLPVGARAVLVEHGVEPDASPPRVKPGLRRPVTRLRAGPLVVEVADSPAGRVRIRRELWGRAWATTVGLCTPTVYGADPDGAWLVGEWIDSAPPGGPDFLDRAIETAERIRTAPPPPPGPPASVWRSPRRAAPARTARAVVARMPLRLWWAARSAARALPQTPVVHGDFYHRNVLWQPDRGRVSVVDWEYLGPGPHHVDLLRMWTILPERAERDALLDRVLAAAPAPERREIAVLGLYLALRLWGENVKAPARDRDAADLAHARSIQGEAHALARAHGAWPL